MLGQTFEGPVRCGRGKTRVRVRKSAKRRGFTRCAPKHVRRLKIGQYPYMEFRHQVMGLGRRRRYLRDLFGNPERGWNWLLKKERVWDLAGLGLGGVINNTLHLLRHQIKASQEMKGAMKVGVQTLTDLVGAIVSFEAGYAIGGKKAGAQMAEAAAVANLAHAVMRITHPIVARGAAMVGLTSLKPRDRQKIAAQPTPEKKAEETAKAEVKGLTDAVGLGVVYEAEGEARRIGGLGLVYESEGEARRIGAPAYGRSTSGRRLPDEEFSAEIYPEEKGGAQVQGVGAEDEVDGVGQEKDEVDGVGQLPEREFKERLAQSELPEREFKERLSDLEGEDVFGDVGDSPF
jgi:hypothetical protein